MKIRSGEPEKPKKYQLSIPDLFQGTVLKLLAKRPEDRYQTAAELADDLRRWRDDRPVWARRIGPLGRLVRWARRNPAHRVRAAEPSKVAVTITPVSKPLKPRCLRYRASNTLAKPSANALTARATTSGRVACAGTPAL